MIANLLNVSVDQNIAYIGKTMQHLICHKAERIHHFEQFSFRNMGNCDWLSTIDSFKFFIHLPMTSSFKL